jgi:TRAP-type transport system periplasmic protein
MEEAYKKAGAKIHEMTQAEYDQWVTLAKDTAWKEFAAKSPQSKELLEALLQVK